MSAKRQLLILADTHTIMDPDDDDIAVSLQSVSSLLPSTTPRVCRSRSEGPDLIADYTRQGATDKTADIVLEFIDNLPLHGKWVIAESIVMHEHDRSPDNRLLDSPIPELPASDSP